jgi:hypothetical protein
VGDCDGEDVGDGDGEDVGAGEGEGDEVAVGDGDGDGDVDDTVTNEPVRFTVWCVLVCTVALTTCVPAYNAETSSGSALLLEPPAMSQGVPYSVWKSLPSR